MNSYRRYRDCELLKIDLISYMFSLHIAGDLSLTDHLFWNCIMRNHPDFDSLSVLHPTLLSNIDEYSSKSCSIIYSNSYYFRYSLLIADPSLSLLFNDDFRGLPPTFIVTPEYDILGDDAVVFCEYLLAFGVEVKIHVARGTFHGFMVLLHENLFPNGANLAYTQIRDAIILRLLQQ